MKGPGGFGEEGLVVTHTHVRIRPCTAVFQQNSQNPRLLIGYQSAIILSCPVSVHRNIRLSRNVADALDGNLMVSWKLQLP